MQKSSHNSLLLKKLWPSGIEEDKETSEIYYSQLVKPSKNFSNSYFVVFVGEREREREVSRERDKKKDQDRRKE